MDDRQINAQFAFEGMIVSEIHSFITQKPSQYSVQALEDSVVWMIKYEDLQTLYQQFNAIQHFGLELTENVGIRFYSIFKTIFMFQVFY